MFAGFATAVVAQRLAVSDERYTCTLAAIEMRTTTSLPHAAPNQKPRSQLRGF